MNFKLFLTVILNVILATSCYSNKKNLKIGIVDLKTVMEKSEWGKEKQQKINSEIAKREKSWNKLCATPLKSIITKLEQLKKSAKNNKTEQVKQLKNKKQQLAFKCSSIKTTYQREIENLNAELASQILKKVKSVTKLLAKQYEFDLIITEYRGVVLFNSSKIDITDLIIKNLEQEQ